MSDAFDVCVIGSGAGGGPVAAAAAEAGYRVVVLEKGPWFEREQFFKDEIHQCRRPTFWPSKQDEPQVWEWADDTGKRYATVTDALWNGTMVGGASVLMSGFFLRLKPEDFRVRTLYGPVEDADVADWPITYDDLEPYYARVEQEVGVSGLNVELPKAFADRRSTEDFPFFPTEEHPFATHIDETCTKMGLNPFPLPRAVLPEDWGDRRACARSGFCASYGCRTGAKGSSLEAFLPRALKTKRCEIRPRSMVTRLVSDERGKVVRCEYVDSEGRARSVEARVFVVACQAVETARLLLNSPGPRHPRGLANGSGLVGRNLVSSTFAAGSADFHFKNHGEWLQNHEPFVNRALQDWYFIDDPKLGKRKGGTVTFLRMHPNPILAAENQAFYDQVPAGRVIWGQELKDKLYEYFHEARHLKLEVFGEWIPDLRAGVSIDPQVRDKWGIPVARVSTWSHRRNKETATYLVERGLQVMRAMGGENPRTPAKYGGASTNLVGGTCRFGKDPARSVLDPDCRAHEAENLFVTDGSFMPSGGSVPPTFTIYANAMRVGDKIVAQLGGVRR
jgi:choline dehydrogenase-like flavoprotein